MRWGLEERITAPASRRTPCNQVDFHGHNTAFISREYFFTVVWCISQLQCEHGQEEAGIEAADRKDCQGLWLQCHPDLHGCRLMEEGREEREEPVVGTVVGLLGRSRMAVLMAESLA